MISELQTDLEKINNNYIDKLGNAVQCGLYSKAKKMVEDEDIQVQIRLREAIENVDMMIKEVDDGKKRLIISQ